jgi:E3 ubiquitin-protein ligase MARCH6
MTRIIFICGVSSDTPVSELSLELLLLQVVLPALLEQGHTRQWLKAMVKGWCVVAALLLDLRSYLLGDVPLDEVSQQLVMIRLCSATVLSSSA